MTLLFRRVAGVTMTTGEPLTMSCSTATWTWEPSSVAMSWKFPGVTELAETGSLNVMRSCSVGETLLALFSGKSETMVGGVASSLTRSM